jgi:hypothetical protein
MILHNCTYFLILCWLGHRFLAFIVYFNYLVLEFTYLTYCLNMFYFSQFSLTGTWTQDFALVRQLLYHLNYFISHFYSGYFWDKSLAFCLGWPGTDFLPFLASWVARHEPFLALLSLLFPHLVWFCFSFHKFLLLNP